MSPPLVTAVICTRNRAEFLKKCLISLQRQTAPAEEYEILVVDNASSDSTVDAVQNFMGHGNVRYIYEPIIGLSRARNTGWKNAAGQYVGYIDDDAVAEDTWVASAVEVFTTVSPVPDWAGGPIELAWEKACPDWINEELMVPLGYVNWGKGARPLTVLERLGGGNSIYPKETLEAVGGFDERLGREKNSLLSGEETQLQKRIEAKGGLLYYYPGIAVRHWVGKERIQAKWFYRRYYWGGVSDYIMDRTLTEDEKRRNKHSAADNQAQSSLPVRVIRNLFLATGVTCSAKKTIHSRIYLSYIVGWLTGTVRWRTKKN